MREVIGPGSGLSVDKLLKEAREHEQRMDFRCHPETGNLLDGSQWISEYEDIADALPEEVACDASPLDTIDG